MSATPQKRKKGKDVRKRNLMLQRCQLWSKENPREKNKTTTTMSARRKTKKTRVKTSWRKTTPTLTDLLPGLVTSEPSLDLERGLFCFRVIKVNINFLFLLLTFQFPFLYRWCFCGGFRLQKINSPSIREPIDQNASRPFLMRQVTVGRVIESEVGLPVFAQSNLAFEGTPWPPS